MKTAEKLNLMKEMEARNEERVQKHLENSELRERIEVSATCIIESLNIISEQLGVKRSDLLELLVDTLWAKEQIKAQEG